MKRAFTMVELLVTIVIMAVLIVSVLSYVSSYTYWGRTQSNKRVVKLLNDGLTRFKHLAPPDKFQVLYAASTATAAPYLFGPYTQNSSYHNMAVVAALKTGFTTSDMGGLQNKFITQSQYIDYNQLTSSGSGNDFWFAEYNGGFTNENYPSALTITGYSLYPLTFEMPADRSGGPSSLTFSLVNNPSWLSINPITGVLTGIPPAINTDVFQVDILANASNKHYIRNVTLNTVLGAPVITSGDTSGYTGVAFPTYTITALNTPVVNYSSTSLPAGLTLNTVTGVISGIAQPGTSGPAFWDYAVILYATNSGGTSSKSINIRVNLSLPSITSPNSTTAQVGYSLNFPVTASNNPSGFAATPISGGFPEFSINSFSGICTGIPISSEAGAGIGTPYTFSVTATNAAGTGAPQVLTVYVVEPPNPAPINVIPST